MKSIDANKDMTFIEEPLIKFNYGQDHIDPRDGLTLFGPLSKGQPVSVNVGIIGPSKSRMHLKNWLQEINSPIFSAKYDLARPSFPGFEAAFSHKINFESPTELDVSMSEIQQYLQYTDNHQRIYNLVNLYSSKLINYVSDDKAPVDVWFVVIPDEVYQYGKPKSRIAKSNTNVTTGIKNKFSQHNPFLFPELDELQDPYRYEVNFHNQLKAKLLKDRILTQIVRESTIAFREFKTPLGKYVRDLSLFESAIAWNICTTLYYKLGGVPWRLSSVRDRVCYVGLVYKKLENVSDVKSACCAAQMFLDSGDGMVFKGNSGKWYNPKTKEFHIDKFTAHSLLKEAIDSYREENNDNFPKAVFIHAKTYFDDEEWAGFEEACEGKTKLVGVRIRPESTFKMYRDSAFPAPRGLVFIVNDRKAYLWTKGFIPKMQTVLGLETPNPLSIEVTRGEEDINIVCKDVISLTKLNYNSCIFADGLPVTLRFANSVGEVITAGPTEGIKRLSFRHYI